MKLAVTPLLITIGMAIVMYLNVSTAADVERCLNEGGHGNGLRTYWEILAKEITLQSVPKLIAYTFIVFLPFVIAAPFIRSASRLYCQWAGIGVVLLMLIVFSVGDETRQNPGWCFQPDMTDVGLLVGLTVFGVLFTITLPIFTFMTLIGISFPTKCTE
jgi:hypothetical protein